MFKAWIGFRKGHGIVFSNQEATFRNLFDYEYLHILLSAFDKDEIIVHGEMVAEDPVQFLVQWIEMDGEELDRPDVRSMAKYLKLRISPDLVELKELK